VKESLQLFVTLSSFRAFATSLQNDDLVYALVPSTADSPIDADRNGTSGAASSSGYSASLLFIGQLFIIIIDIFCTYAFLAGLYRNIWYRFFNTLVCNISKYHHSHRQTHLPHPILGLFLPCQY
jgi:hypothetical protein